MTYTNGMVDDLYWLVSSLDDKWRSVASIKSLVGAIGWDASQLSHELSKLADRGQIERKKVPTGIPSRRKVYSINYYRRTGTMMS